jgi:hypothetical protein
MKATGRGLVEGKFYRKIKKLIYFPSVASVPTRQLAEAPRGVICEF